MAFAKQLVEHAINKRGATCEKCRRRVDPELLYPHHIVPVEMGGSNHEYNLYLVCSDCHKRVDTDTRKNGLLANGLSLVEAGEMPEMIDNVNRFIQFTKRFDRQATRR